MALSKKRIKGSGLVNLRQTISSSDGTTVQTTETLTGAYADLKIKWDSLFLVVKNTSLTPTEAGQGELKITTEQVINNENGLRPPSIITTEVIWQELRQAVELHPYFAELSADQKKEIRAIAEDKDQTVADLPDDRTLAHYELYRLIAAGVTDYALGVPVVRRTTTNVQGNIGGGEAWFRDEPPVEVDGEWEWMKTADERRSVGRRFDLIEEWTGAKVWDPILYP